MSRDTGRDNLFPNMSQSGALWFDSGASVQALKAFGTNLFNVVSGDLSGTSGPAGETSVSVERDALQIENRTAAPVRYVLTFIG